ncbi:MAG: 4Fe-4S dicluster domain-containing protein [Anaerolineales bacterium]|nr:4Fe-4S dicluster domain-containing protein [Anaerolineales bacterium]
MKVQPVNPQDPNPNLRFLEEVSAKTAGVSRLEMCIQCGTCGGSCPCSADMDHTPRMLFAMIRAGFREQALRSNTPWICVSCYHCVVRCPQDVHITDVMYTLKSMAVRSGYYADSPSWKINKTAADFSGSFIKNVNEYGRSWEAGLATVHSLKHFPLRAPNMAPMGLGMWSKKRLNITPKRIKGIEQLQAILKRANELEVS